MTDRPLRVGDRVKWKAKRGVGFTWGYVHEIRSEDEIYVKLNHQMGVEVGFAGRTQINYLKHPKKRSDLILVEQVA